MYRHPLLQSITPYLSALAKLADPICQRHVKWTPLATATAAVLMALDKNCSLAVRCQDAQLAMRQDFAGGRGVGHTYNGWIKALGRQSATALPLLKTDLRRRAQATLQRIPRLCGWTLMAVDGSKEDLPRTVSHETHFGIADNGKEPQAYTTAIVEVQTHLLWDWRVDRGDASEKGHLVDMAQGLPERTLLLADGNFVGYRVWQALAKAQRHFLIRVGGNVHLLQRLWPQATIERRGDTVYAWPVQLQHKVPPLRLRLLRVGPPEHRVYLLTNVLDRRRLTRPMAGRIYRSRWGVEVFYRDFKRTMGFAKLQSRSAARGQLELEWALLACWIAMLLSIDATTRRGGDPRRLSPAGLLGQLRHSLLQGKPGRRSARRLLRALAHCLRDAYQRHGTKASRHRPITRNTPKEFNRLRPPRIRPATLQERRLAEEYRLQAAA